MRGLTWSAQASTWSDYADRAHYGDTGPWYAFPYGFSRREAYREAATASWGEFVEATPLAGRLLGEPPPHPDLVPEEEL